MLKFAFVLSALTLSIAAVAASDRAEAVNLGTAAGAAAHPLGALLNPSGRHGSGNIFNPNDLHSGGRSMPRDGVIKPAQDFSFSSQSEGSGSYAVTVNKKLLDF